ncbi:MAG: Coenzyme F420 hydrogenase/dehydrogenase, beta subunit C-terminal domain [Desulfobacterales bacterium]|nr:MAG: Coenzyme F420 hydrogenase/dehydrogenase, beta subunit C-terminal domain [Desulfobacterales bacterium]
MTARIDVTGQDLLASLRQFLRAILELQDIRAILVPRHLPMNNAVMPALVTDPDCLEGVDPLAPAFPMNAAKIVSRLTGKPMGAQVAAILRPCEIRAFIELVKLKQGRTEEVVLIGIDCLGAYQNKDYLRFAGEDGAHATVRFYQSVLTGRGTRIDGVDLAPACRACEYPVASNADITIGLFGIEFDDHLIVQSQSVRGEAVLKQLNLEQTVEPTARRETIAALVAQRTAQRDEMLAQTRAGTENLAKMTTYFARCVNCYNCRVACPVCYCKECVFVTDVFNHDPYQYLRWATRKGVIKMPTDTLFYHMTRLAHMSTACVGCGQCSNACPNDIPVMEVFRSVAQATQKAFDYEAGRHIDEDPPLAVFREDEFAEVVGMSLQTGRQA